MAEKASLGAVHRLVDRRIELAQKHNAWVLAHALLFRVEQCPGGGMRGQLKNVLTQFFTAGSRWLVSESTKG